MTSLVKKGECTAGSRRVSKAWISAQDDQAPLECSLNEESLVHPDKTKRTSASSRYVETVITRYRVLKCSLSSGRTRNSAPNRRRGPSVNLPRKYKPMLANI